MIVRFLVGYDEEGQIEEVWTYELEGSPITGVSFKAVKDEFNNIKKYVSTNFPGHEKITLHIVKNRSKIITEMWTRDFKEEGKVVLHFTRDIRNDLVEIEINELFNRKNIILHVGRNPFERINEFWSADLPGLKESKKKRK